jgi:ATP-binding cassette subfamily B protein
MILLEAFMLYLALDLWQQGKVTPGDFILIQGYLLEVLVFAWDFGRTVRTTYRAFAEAQEMTDLLNQPLAVEDKPKAPKLKVSKGAIEFKKVHFAYGKQGQVLRDLKVSIQPGEKVALIGPSGGGKTTLIKLLLRLFDVQSGEILIDGQNIAEVTQASLRRSIALVPQDTSLFHRSLMENIRYGRLGATDAEVLAAAKKANCHDFIMKFPQGYQTHVGERGVKLSGGERQRIAIARAILSEAPILILDEATSSLDIESERLVQAALKTLLKGKTALVIAHRLSTITNMDRIVVLEKGRIVEEGSHDALLKKEDGRYRKFWDLQVGAYLA